MRIAVTGASGFVGGAVCRAAVEAGWTVHPFGRRASPTDGPAGGHVGGHVGGAPYRSWDLLGARPRGLPRVDAVVHCAGSVTDWGPPHHIWAANVHGTRAVLAAFPGARFVHVSTASVYDPFRPTVMAREDAAPVRRYVNAYGASKARAEQLVIGRGIVLRPHAVYGKGDTTLLPRVLGAVRGRWLPAVGSGRQRISLTSVDNLVSACLLAASGPVDRGVYNVTDADPITLDEALRAILRERGVRARPYYLPARVVEPLAGVVEAVCERLGTTRPPRLTRYAVGHLAVERTLDISAARRDLGFKPEPTSFLGAADW
ncbi:NAD-dependent epimerase/dehydratase family protein [Sinosporangium siamense]|uniref:NAD-dependent epimerase n=1 Tax=Sinosporangium siamense TaxID=1367973 RepID=A0A919RKT8_9ACTN|nr:NAD(P)-dependent oxidoreductase [Sinosporangium siamense]GII95623.1 NAD-dependent epimerase [Sinosporangium siamense]